MSRGERDSHCSAHPLSRRAAGALHTQHGRKSPPSGARAVPHSPRVGGRISRLNGEHQSFQRRNAETTDDAERTGWTTTGSVHRGIEAL